MSDVSAELHDTLLYLDGVTVTFADQSGTEISSVHGSALVGADGIHSTVREALHPDEGPPRWNGTMLWRGATDWPAFLTGGGPPV